MRGQTCTSQPVTHTSPCHLSHAYPASTHTRSSVDTALCPGQRIPNDFCFFPHHLFLGLFFCSQHLCRPALSLNLYFSLSLRKNKDRGEKWHIHSEPRSSLYRSLSRQQTTLGQMNQGCLSVKHENTFILMKHLWVRTHFSVQGTGYGLFPKWHLSEHLWAHQCDRYLLALNNVSHINANYTTVGSALWIWLVCIRFSVFASSGQVSLCINGGNSFCSYIITPVGGD